MNAPRTVFFIGKPGCGKGTQARLLAERTGWAVRASGAEFRAIAAEDTAAGRKIKEEIDQGMLAPHWFAMYLYQRALFSLPENADVIFDGFNRKVGEAELIVDSLNWLGRPFVVLEIDIRDDTVRERLSGRSKTEGRADDRQDAIEERLEEYETHTTKALKIFEDMGVLIKIDGEPSPGEVAKAVAAALQLP
jgi:adenylate kinase